MSLKLKPWLEHNARIQKPGPFDHAGIAGDVVEIDPSWFNETGMHVLEGQDAADSMRRQLTDDEREKLGVQL
jgi:hypothetical protein